MQAGLRLVVLVLVACLVAPLPAAAERPHGAVLAWGCEFSDFGQCAVPAPAGSGVKAVAAGLFVSLALTSDGRVVAWGCGSGRDTGQCAVPEAAQSGVVAIAAGPYHGLALRSDGSVVAWGCAVVNWGQCSVPPEASSGVTAISAGFNDSLALKDGRVLAWGCGIDNVGQCTVPAAAQSGVTAIAAGLYHSLALRSDGSVVAWGCTGGTSTFPPQPSDYGQCNVPAAAQSGVTAIAAGDFQSLALKSDGSVVAWGCGSNGGFNLDFGQCAVPPAAGSGVKAIAAGEYHSLALKDGGVVAWGCHGGSASACSVPATATTGVTAIAASGHSLALSDPLEQTITVTTHAPATAIDGTSFTVAASSSAGLAVTYSSAGACSNAGPTFTMTSPTGTCEVKYDQPGGGAYDAAPQVVESVAAQPRPCTVPNVVGKKLRAAKQAIVKRHCRTGKVRSIYSRKRKKGVVVSQSRRAGLVLPAGSRIDLAVSRGRKR
jgi:Regulator of chromosome condensation (RCC1) repeat/PASTA domain